MFKGESSVKFKSAKPIAEVFSLVEDTLQPLGKVQINNRGVISVSPKDKYQSFLTDTTIEGDVRKEKTPEEYTLTIKYDCSPSVMNWIITIGGFACLVWVVIGVACLALPVLSLMTKNNLAKDAEKLLHDVEAAFESAK
jgi:heme exporter protein D